MQQKKPAPSPRLRLLEEKVAEMGEAVEAERQAIERVKSLLGPGEMWVLSSGVWKLRHGRHGGLRAG